jgi:hypothetical protein
MNCKFPVLKVIVPFTKAWYVLTGINTEDFTCPGLQLWEYVPVPGCGVRSYGMYPHLQMPDSRLLPLSNRALCNLHPQYGAYNGDTHPFPNMGRAEGNGVWLACSGLQLSFFE